MTKSDSQWSWEDESSENNSNSSNTQPQPQYGQKISETDTSNNAKVYSDKNININVEVTSPTQNKQWQDSTPATIVPLKPLTAANIFDGIFKALRANPIVFFGLSFIIIAVATVIDTAWSYSAGIYESATLGIPNLSDEELLRSIPAFLTYHSGALLLTFISTQMVTAVSVVAISDLLINKKYSIKYYMHEIMPKTLKLILLSIVTSTISFVATIMLFVVLALPVSATIMLNYGTNNYILPIIIGIAAVAIFILGTMFIVIKLLFATPVLLIEDTGILQSISRSWTLSKGAFWKIFAIYILLAIMSSMLYNIIIAPSIVLSMMTTSTLLQLLSASVFNLFASTIVIPILSIGTTLVYIDQRMRKEGLDVRLREALQQNQMS